MRDEVSLKKTKANGSLVVGILSLFICWIPVVGMWFSWCAILLAHESVMVDGTKSFRATVGDFLGTISVVIAILWTCLICFGSKMWYAILLGVVIGFVISCLEIIVRR